MWSFPTQCFKVNICVPELVPLKLYTLLYPIVVFFLITLNDTHAVFYVFTHSFIFYFQKGSKFYNPKQLFGSPARYNSPYKNRICSTFIVWCAFILAWVCSLYHIYICAEPTVYCHCSDSFSILFINLCSFMYFILLNIACLYPAHIPKYIYLSWFVLLEKILWLPFMLSLDENGKKHNVTLFNKQGLLSLFL